MATQETRIKALLTSIGTDWKNIWAKIGLGNLDTSAQNLVAAVNEVKATADAAQAGTAPDTTTSLKGISRRATDTEALAMSAGDLTVSPSNLAALKNVAGGFPVLDGTGKVAAAQLPGYVDDVLEFANLASFPVTGSTGVIYVALNTNTPYRWGGSSYVEISASPGSTDAVPEGSTNLYYTNSRVDARVAALVGDTDFDYAAYYAAAKS